MSGAPWHTLAGLDPAGPFPATALCGDNEIVVFHLGGGRYRGVQRHCPHQKVDLALGTLMGNATMLRCVRHAYTFRLADGKGVNCPGYRMRVYEVEADAAALRARALSQD